MIKCLKFSQKETNDKIESIIESSADRYTLEVKKAIRDFDDKLALAHSAYQSEMDRAYLEFISSWKASFDDREICAMTEVSVRIKNCLRNDSENDRPMLSDLVIKYTENDLLSIPNFGKKSVQELKELLNMMGLEIGIFHKSNWHHG